MGSLVPSLRAAGAHNGGGSLGVHSRSVTLPNPNISAAAPGQPLLQKILRRTQGDEIFPIL